MPDFKKYILINAEPEEVYAALTYESTVQLWTSSSATIRPEPGAEFSMWDESITGKFLAVEPGKMIQQEWDFGDLPEPSIVTIKLHPDKRGTSMEVRHTNIPEESYKDIVEGWNEVYLRELAEFYW